MTKRKRYPKYIVRPKYPDIFVHAGRGDYHVVLYDNKRPGDHIAKIWRYEYLTNRETKFYNSYKALVKDYFEVLL